MNFHKCKACGGYVRLRKNGNYGVHYRPETPPYKRDAVGHCKLSNKKPPATKHDPESICLCKECLEAA